MIRLSPAARHALAVASVVVGGALLTAVSTHFAREEYERETSILFAPFAQQAELAARHELAEYYEKLEGWRDALELIPSHSEADLQLLFRSHARGRSLQGIRQVALISLSPAIRDPGKSGEGLVRVFHLTESGKGATMPLREPAAFLRSVEGLNTDTSVALLAPSRAGLDDVAGQLAVLPVLDRRTVPGVPSPVSRWLVAVIDFNTLLKSGLPGTSPANMSLTLRQLSGGAVLSVLGPAAASTKSPDEFRRDVRNMQFGTLPLELATAVPTGTAVGDEQDWTRIVLGAGALLTMLLAYGVHSLLQRRSKLTERASQLQLSVRDSEQRFRDIVESSRDWVWETDTEGVYTYCSPSSELLFGYAPDQIIGTRGEFLWTNSSAGGVQGSDSSRMRVARHRSGAAVTLESRAFPILATDGRPRGFRGFDRDISQRIELESELHTLQGRLLKVIQAEGAGQTLMGLAHEINQPLAAIAAYNQACLRMAESETGIRAEIVAAIKATADNAVLAGDIIRKFRGVVAATQVNRTPLQLRKVIQESVEITRSRIRSEEVRMTLSVSTELPEILGDATLIKQVILNLIGNAIDAMSGAPERTLRITARLASPDKVRVEVSDSGPGVREEYRERIFDPYFTTKAGGLGMGLAISKAIIEAHGESIASDARAEGGATFWFTLGVGEG